MFAFLALLVVGLVLFIIDAVRYWSLAAAAGAVITSAVIVAVWRLSDGRP